MRVASLAKKAHRETKEREPLKENLGNFSQVFIKKINQTLYIKRENERTKKERKKEKGSEEIEKKKKNRKEISRERESKKMKKKRMRD